MSCGSCGIKAIKLKITGTILYRNKAISMATDPVCLMIVDEDDVKFTSTYRNQKYYFCCNWCKTKFDENPKRYSRMATDMSVDLGGSCD